MITSPHLILPFLTVLRHQSPHDSSSRGRTVNHLLFKYACLPACLPAVTPISLIDIALQGGSTRALRSVGLSTLALHVLGRPLDKSMQMSDWEARPLSQRQVVYAAQVRTRFCLWAIKKKPLKTLGKLPQLPGKA